LSAAGQHASSISLPKKQKEEQAKAIEVELMGKSINNQLALEVSLICIMSATDD